MPAVGPTAGPPAEGEDPDGSDPTWWRREGARMRQILIGKARPEYKRYVSTVPVEKRDPTHPRTPDPRQRVSKRQFDRNLGEWRKKLHEFDARPWALDSPRPTDHQPPNPVGTVAPRSLPERMSRRQRAAQMDKSNGCGTPGTPKVPVRSTKVDTVLEAARVVQLRLAEQLPEFSTAADSPWHLSNEADRSPQPATPQRTVRQGRGVRENGMTPAPVPAPPRTKVPQQGPIATSGSSPCVPVPEKRLHGDFEPLSLFDNGNSTSGTGGTRRLPTPPPPVPSGTPRTPEKVRNSGLSPPSSVLKTPKTPTRGNWVMDTPSPQRFHYALLPSLPSQLASSSSGQCSSMDSPPNSWHIGNDPLWAQLSRSSMAS